MASGGTVAARLASAGVILPEPGGALGSYVPVLVTGDQAWVSGMLPMEAGELTARGRVGEGVAVERAIEAARTCAINILGALQHELGDLDRVQRVLRLTGYVAAVDSFDRHPEVVDGASILFTTAFGELGRHSRVAVGVASLPKGAPVEVAAVFQVGSRTEE